LVGSLQAQNVTNPLPIIFDVVKNTVTPVNIEVLSTATHTPNDFGFSNFPIIEVKTFGVVIGITDKQSGKLLSAKITVSNASYSYVQNLDSIANNVVIIKDGLNNYTITIEKTGYQTYVHTYTIDSFKMFKDIVGNLPLIIKLQKVLSLGTWSKTTSFIIPRASHSSIVYNGYLYVIGGTDGNSRFNDVQFAHINLDGSLGTWQNTTSLNTAAQQSSSIEYNGYIYVIGGCGPQTATNVVQYSKINTDGTLGTWQNATSLNQGRQVFGCAFYNGYIYVIQGFFYSAASPVTDVEFAKINSDGSIGNWESTTTFGPARFGNSSATYNGYIYNAGGTNWNGNYYSLGDVQYSSINTDGTLNSWISSTSLEQPMTGFCMVQYDGYLITNGGSLTNGASNEVACTRINSDGSIGNWINLTSLNINRSGHTSIVYNSYLYVIGGADATGNLLNDVQFAKLQ
jgi:hypothetical protein